MIREAESAELNAILDEGLRRLEARDGLGAIEYLCVELDKYRLRASEEQWREWCLHCRRHPICHAVHQDPYTWRAYSKPRGYAGDAVMLDYVYSGRPPDKTSAMGRVVFAGTTRTTNGLSVVDRRDRLSKWIDEEAERAARPRLMSIACGHLREVGNSCAMTSRAVEVFFAMDQDSESLEIVARECPRDVVRPIHAPLTQLLRNAIAVESLDFIYAAGLLDYLSDRLAARTIERMFALLRPGGRLIVANFTPQSSGRSYMEAFMDWWLIYRSASELRNLSGDIDASEVTQSVTVVDQFGNIAYLDIRKEPSRRPRSLTPSPIALT